MATILIFKYLLHLGLWRKHSSQDSVSYKLQAANNWETHFPFYVFWKFLFRSIKILYQNSVAFVFQLTLYKAMTILEFSQLSEIKNSVAKRKMSPCTEETELKKERLLEEKRFSNDMTDSCCHQCRMCDRLVTLTSLRSHTRASHHITIKEYVEQFGNYREQLHNVTWHKCGVCNKEILLDGDEIHKHCRVHGLTMAEYSNLYIKKTSKLHGPPIPVKLKVLEEKKVTGLIDTIEAIENILDSL